MKHIAKRLAKYANEHKIIHVNNIKNVALRKFATDKTINHKIRKALKDIDSQLELLIPYQVDNHEQQFKRYLQNKYGLVINLSKLKKEHNHDYRRLCTYGSPPDVLRKWGLDYTYDRNIPKERIKDMLEAYADSNNRISRKLKSKDRKLYMAIFHQARKEGVSVKDYIEGLGYVYS